ncbi:MAG: hypothetical protein KC431_04155 [Myxococcales bacterium]|nr:hypothetical protein [Myxococcales bacterium]MCA9696698.1 hypothetical protein [Myxococcales bacterium]
MAIREPERYYDRRTIKRHIKRGHVSETDYQRFIETLPDVTENIMPYDDGGDEDGYEPDDDDVQAPAPTPAAPIPGLRAPSIGATATVDDDSDID